jgi:hypothetical protein
MGQRALPHPRPLSRSGGRGVSRSAGRGEGSLPQGLRPVLSRLAGPLTGLRKGRPHEKDIINRTPRH